MKANGKKTTGKQNAEKGARKHNQDSIEIRLMSDDIYRASQTKVGWTRTYCQYLDFLTTIDLTLRNLETAKSIRKQPCIVGVQAMRKGADFRKPLADLQLFNVNKDE